MVASNDIATCWAEGWSAQEIEKVSELFQKVVADDCRYEDVTFSVDAHGIKELMAFARWFLIGVPDFRVDIVNQFVEGGHGGWEWVCSGTHRATFGEGAPPALLVPATGKSFQQLRGATLAEIQDGKIISCRDYWDSCTLLGQIGLLPEIGKH